MGHLGQENCFNPSIAVEPATGASALNLAKPNSKTLFFGEFF